MSTTKNIKMKINKYPDGTSYVAIPKEWEDTTQKITFRINTYEDLVHLIQLCDVLIHNRVQAHITIPCLLDAQADKRFGEFNSSGLVVIARMLEPYINGYDISLSVFHPHNPLVVEALFTGVECIDNSKFINKVLNLLPYETQKELNDNLILMSADAGGFKPLMDLCDKLKWQGETFMAGKARNYHAVSAAKLTQVIDREDFDGKDILIIDDISVYGGTFKGLSKLLRERNCGKLYLAVSHMTVQNLGEDPVTNYFDEVFITNSKFDKYTFMVNDKNHGVIPTTYQPKNLKVIKMF